MLPKELEWDSDRLGVRVGKIECAIKTVGDGIKRMEKWMEEYSLVYLFNKHNLGEQIAGEGFAAHEYGGRKTYAVARDDLRRLVGRQCTQTTHCSVEVVQEYQVEKVVDLMTHAMMTSRFFLDKEIKNGFATELYRVWAYDGVVGHGKITLGCLMGQDIRGALTISMHKKEAWEIELLAVDPRYRGLGIGMTLVQAALQKAKANKSAGMKVVTQRTNYAATRLYRKCGFVLVQESFVYHVHKSLGKK